MEGKKQIFLITIAVLEGRHYIWMNMDSAVIVSVGDKRKYTNVRYGSDAPYYNEYFVFEFFTTLETILDKQISITVIQPGNIWRRRKILGNLALDVATVWTQDQHQFYHKWAILSSTKNDINNSPRGYIKLDISVLVKGEVPKTNINILHDDIEGNLLLPQGIRNNERQKASYIFDIFRCQNLVKNPLLYFKDDVDLSENKADTKGPTTYIEITFAGKTVRTSSRKHSSSPEFNERLTIIDLFPPLCQRLKIGICMGNRNKKKVRSQRFINLNQISNANEDGYLPTFGPVFLNTSTNNPLDGYVGSILMSMRTKLIDTVLDAKKDISIDVISALKEQKYLRYEDISLFTCIFEITALDKKYSGKSVSVRMTLGDCSTQRADNVILNSTDPWKPKRISKDLFTLQIQDKKPCLWILKEIPCHRRRMFNSNILSKIRDWLSENVCDIEKCFEGPHSEQNFTEIEEKIQNVIDYLQSSCRKYLDIVSSYNMDYSTDLDKERMRICIKEINEAVTNIGIIDVKISKKKAFRKLKKILGKVDGLIEDVQDSCPNAILWIVQGVKKIALFQTGAREIIFSPVSEERGQYCSIKRSICFHSSNSKKDDIVCKMDIIQIICLSRQKDEVMRDLLPEFELETIDALPRYLVVQEKYVYIFEGRILFGFDKTGLADAFIRITAADQVRETKVIKNLLNPIWDQVLICENITLYGSKEYIRRNIPSIIMEVYDRDILQTDELVGRCLIKPAVKMVEDEKTLPKLEWLSLMSNMSNNVITVEILAACVYTEVSKDDEPPKPDSKHAIYNIPVDIKPALLSFKIEVLFWGLRNLKSVNMISINRPRISVYCSDGVLHSDTIDNALKNPNFPNQTKSFCTIIAAQREYAPAIRFRLFDSRTFGIYVYAGVHLSDLSPFLYNPMTSDERNKRLADTEYRPFDSVISVDSIKDQLIELEQMSKATQSTDRNVETPKKRFKFTFESIFKKRPKKHHLLQSRSSVSTYELLPQDDDFDVDDLDWWSKFHASLEHGSDTPVDSRRIHKLKIYNSELENQPEFCGFTDMLRSFEMCRGKMTGDETLDMENITGIFKGDVKIYRWPPPTEDEYVNMNGTLLQDGFFKNYPQNIQLRYIIRVYCIRGLNLRPKDLNGRSDPYLYLKLNKVVVNDKENVLMRQINPVFGRCFEFNACFPHDHTITIAVWDYDVASNDDLIGETTIDLEKRYYTKYRAHCGISDVYERAGYCTWRDPNKPTDILYDLCRKWNLACPEYEANCVRVGMKFFAPDDFTPSDDPVFDKEVIALTALRRWKEMPLVGFELVPEHVETRSLYNPNKPGIEQGKLQLWIDILPIGPLPPPKRVDIAPRKREYYELRVIVWNTSDVLLDEDDFFTGEKMSDIYVKGWLTENATAQYTDVHYRSLTGEGNFNWRFVFQFEYLPTENKLVMRKKESAFARDESEIKIPCQLTLQVWDNDSFSKDDFLGTLTLELAKLYRGAKHVKKCNLSITEKGAPSINLFKNRRTKGWWPFRTIDKKTNKEICAGKIEAELELLTREEARSEPAGLGRHEPQALSAPKRPDTSFSWFRNPFYAFKYALCKLYKWRIINCCIFLAIIVFVALAFYAFPGYTIKKILGA